MITVRRISVIIATLHRNHHLLRCLDSLLKQTIMPDEIIVIDNSPLGSAKKVVDGFQKKFPSIRHFIQPKRGIAYAKNMGINKAKNEILAFIDDDCTADREWIQTIKASYKRGIDSVMGKNINGNPHNIYSCLEYYYTERSIISRLYKLNGKTYTKLVDPKNFSILKRVMKRDGIMFDESFGSHAGLEEVDFSKRLTEKGIRVGYDPSMKVSHHGRTSFVLHTKREYRRGRALYFFYEKRMQEVLRDIQVEVSKSARVKAGEYARIKKVREMVLADKSIMFKFMFKLLDLYSNSMMRLGFALEKRSH